MRLLSIFCAFACVSCVQFQGPDGTKVTSLGGRGTFKSASFAGSFDHRQSFREGTLALAAVASSGFAYLGDKAAEGTAQLVNTNATKQAINASKDATKVSLGAQQAGVETAKILSQ